MVALVLAALSWAAPAPVAVAEDFRLLTVDGQPLRWDLSRLAAGEIITYAIVGQEVVTPGAGNCGRIVSPTKLLESSRLKARDLERAVAAAFARWSQVANVSFVESFDVATAQILIGAQGDPVGTAYTQLLVSSKVEPAANDVAYRSIVGARICLNPQKRWKVGFDGNLTSFDLEHVIAHEIGHAIGLDHPSARGHVMSFRYLETLRSLTSGDQRGAQSLYGASAARASAAVGTKSEATQ